MLKKTLILTLAICAITSLTMAQENWEIIESPTIESLSSITFFTPEIGIILVDNETILRTEDGGLNWVIVTVPGGGAQGATSTLDGSTGYDWNSSRSNTTSISTGDGIIVGLVGFIALTENHGLDWVSSPSGTLADLFGVAFPDSNTVIVVGDSGTILKSTDAGNSFEKIQSVATMERLNSVDFFDENKGVIFGNNGTALRTTDAGSSWTTFTIDTSGMTTNYVRSRHDINQIPITNATMVGDEGFIAYTTNSGQDWTTSGSGPNSNLIGVDYYDSTTIVVAGAGGTVAISYDGGNNFQLVDGIPTTAELMDVFFTDDKTGFIVGDSGVILRTLDIGPDTVIFAGLRHISLGQAQLSLIDSSLVVSNIGSSGEYGVEIELPNVDGFSLEFDSLFILPAPDSTHPATFRYTVWGELTGGGLSQPIGQQTLINISPDTTEFWVDFDFIGSDSVIIEVFKDSQLVGADTVPTGFVGYIIGSGGALASSGDPLAAGGDPLKGLNISRAKKPCVHSISYIPDVNLNGLIGTQISLIPVNPTSGALENFTRLTIHVGHIDHGKFTILSESIDSVLTSIESDRVGEIPKDFTLDNNYPNPFNPVTTIKYALPKPSNVSLVIYNLMGQEIMRWDESNFAPGYYEKTWNGINKDGLQVGSGIYFYRLQAGDFIETKKMILMK